MGEVTFNHVFSHTDSTGRLSMGPPAHQQALLLQSAGPASGGMQQGLQLPSPLLASELQLPTGPREAADEEGSEVPRSQPGSAEPESAAGINGLRSAMQRNLEVPVQAGITPTGVCAAASAEGAGPHAELLDWAQEQGLLLLKPTCSICNARDVETSMAYRPTGVCAAAAAEGAGP